MLDQQHNYSGCPSQACIVTVLLLGTATSRCNA